MAEEWYGMAEDKEIRMAAQIMSLLAKNKCSCFVAERILGIVQRQLRTSAILCEKDYLKELIDFYKPKLR